MRLLFLTGVRTGELRLAVPEQFDLVRGIWTIPAVIVKQLQVRLRKEGSKIPPYVVPLSRQAIAIVHELLILRRPAQRYLLSHRSDLSKRISENTLNTAIKRMGYERQLTVHGIRATLTTYRSFSSRRLADLLRPSSNLSPCNALNAYSGFLQLRFRKRRMVPLNIRCPAVKRYPPRAARTWPLSIAA